MEQMIDLKDLLKHEIMDLHSAEQQIIDALPSMIEKSRNAKLKTALKDHLRVTEEQKKRLEELQQMMGEEAEQSESDEKRGWFSNLFSREEKCKGMEGLIAEGEKLMGAEMSPEASDAAIIAAAQKIEHYEISGYGTARAYARELKLDDVAQRLEQTLNEEYEADDLLTELAVGKLNIEAESATGMEGSRQESRRRSNGRSNGKTSTKTNGRSSSKSRSNGSTTQKASASKSASKSSASKSSASRSSASKSSATSKSAGKGSASLRKTSASNGRGTSSKSASKRKSGGNSKSSGSKRSSAKTSGRSKSSRGR